MRTKRLAAALAAAFFARTAAAGEPLREKSPPRAPVLEGARSLASEPATDPARDAALARARAEADDLRRRGERAARQSASVLGDMARLDQELALRQAEQREAELAEASERAGATAAAARADALARRLVATRRRVAHVVMALDRAGTPPAGAFLLAQDALGADGSVIVLRQAALAREVATEERAQRSAAAEAERRREAAARWLGLASSRVAATRQARAVRERALAELRVDASRAAAALADLERADGDLQDDLTSRRLDGWQSVTTAADVEATDLPGLASRRGELTWPIGLDERAPVIETFGRVLNPTRGTRTIRHGVVLGAPAGTPILAVAAGRVVFRGWYKGFGRALVLDHGRGFLSVYAHAEDFTHDVGEDVVEGQVLGTVGDTGSLAGPRLYVQLQHGGTALDPLDWLRRR